jgi:hypothetical protein
MSPIGIQCFNGPMPQCCKPHNCFSSDIAFFLPAPTSLPATFQTGFLEYPTYFVFPIGRTGRLEGTGVGGIPFDKLSKAEGLIFSLGK